MQVNTAGFENGNCESSGTKSHDRGSVDAKAIQPSKSQYRMTPRDVGFSFGKSKARIAVAQ
jgi:hypothetical protein